MPLKGEASLWDIVIHEAAQADQIQQEPQDVHAGDAEKTPAGAESTIVFMGSKSAGKTTIILRFLEKEEPPKPTTALEYTFGRKAKGHNMTKDVAHIWELGGGTFLSELVEVPIKEESLLSFSVMLVLDLSHPNELWVTMEILISAALKRIEQVMAKLSTTNPRLREQIKSRSQRRLGTEHPDQDVLDPFPLPLVIVGSKYDIFQCWPLWPSLTRGSHVRGRSNLAVDQLSRAVELKMCQQQDVKDFDSEKRKMICKSLRFIAHNYGAALQFCSTKNEGLMNRTKAYVGHLVFGTSMSNTAKLLNFDHSKPIMVPFGMDTLEQIGLPPVAEGDVGRFDAHTPMDLWKSAYTSFFPQQNLYDKLAVDDPAKDIQYVESAVDSIREQKDKDLEQYRRQVESKSARMAEVTLRR